MQLALGTLECRVEITVIEIIANNQEIDIARRRIRAFRYRSKDKCYLDVWSMRPQGLGQGSRHSDGLENEALQLAEYWGLGIGPVMLLIADPLGRYETTAFQALQFTLDGARSRIDGPQISDV